MDREEQIKQASIDYTFLKGIPMCVCGDAFAEMADELNRNRAFEEGAKWADSNPVNIWHKADEEPANKDAIILCLSKYMVRPLSYKCSWLIDHIESWENAVKNLSITHWLYLEDIIPEDYITDYQNNLLWMAKLKT